jgi:hypothetical protein
MRRILILLALLTLGVWGGLFTLIHSTRQPSGPLPTLFVLPSLTPTATASPTLTATIPPTPTASMTATATVPPTMTPLPTLATRVIEIAAHLPGVSAPPTLTPYPTGWVLLAAPPEPREPLPDATRGAPPFFGWHSFESDHPDVRYTSPWQARQVAGASRGQYHRSDDSESRVLIPFDGEAFRVRYVAARNMGTFEVIVDGVLLDTVDAYAAELRFPASAVYTVGRGAHLLELRPTGRKYPQSEGTMFGFDALQVYRSTPNTYVVPPTPDMVSPTQEIRQVDVDLIAAPPTPRPTVTVQAPVALTVSLVIAYDENGSKAIDPAEGVAGIPVRVVEAGTNRVLVSAFTDASGYAELRYAADQPTRLVAPYFGKSWNIPAGRAAAVHRFTLLLVPGNQPGLIP